MRTAFAAVTAGVPDAIVDLEDLEIPAALRLLDTALPLGQLEAALVLNTFWPAEEMLQQPPEGLCLILWHCVISVHLKIIDAAHTSH